MNHTSRRLPLAGLLVVLFLIPQAHAQLAPRTEAPPASVNLRTSHNEADTPASRPFSLSVGGMAIGRSLLAITKTEYRMGRWSVAADLTRDSYRERYSDGSDDGFRAWSGALTGRIYRNSEGRGLYGEAGFSYTALRLRVDAAGGGRTDYTDTMPSLTWGGGYRLPIRSRLFAEIGYRGNVFLKETHLHAGATPPAGSTDESISQHSWYFGSGASSGTAYLAVGLSF